MGEKSQEKDARLGAFGLGARIKEARKKLGLTQEALALRLGLSPNTINRYEKGHRSPDADMVIQFSEALECDKFWLVTGNMPASVKEGSALFKDEALSKMVEQLQRIYKEGNFKKLAAIQSMLSLADPTDEEEK